MNIAFSPVKVWEENIVIPTYKAGKSNKNPMFLEKRVYQGSTGKVYPHSVIDRISDEKEDVVYKAVYIENDFIKVMVLPELGGRIQRAYDKTNGYDFVYYNHVIKPALVGLAGPWVSGGIEFNWPQHHRPSTFDNVDYSFCQNEDSSATIVVGEIENMFRTKGITRITLYPDSTYIELKTQLFNRTNVPQTFLWWANPAVSVNENTRSIFPTDVTAVMDHGKRAVSSFPIATGTYYKVDYSAGVDISKYKNLPVPTSYMVANSSFDFFGGYDDGVGAGILHFADHHVSPGKKQWTWGCGDFGKAWDRNLTDCDGPYVELMAGCFTDNQPDFSWISPMEEKRFTQYFMPYHTLGTVHNANKDLAMNIEDGKVNLYAIGNVGEIDVEIKNDDKIVANKHINMKPTDFESIDFCDKEYCDYEIKATVFKNGNEYLLYQKSREKSEIPEPAKCPPTPIECETIEDLFLYGMHIEQYRHATYLPEDYYLEGLKRDETDIRLNNAYGLLLFKSGLFEESEKHFRTAISKATRQNPNPYDSEPYYNLGLSLLFQNRLKESYDAFYKSTWSDACKPAAFYQMACVMARINCYDKALEHAEDAVICNGRNYNAMILKMVLLLKLGKTAEVDGLVKKVIALDPLNYQAKIMLGESPIMNFNTAIEVAIEFANAGFYDLAIKTLKINHSDYPLTYYYIAFYFEKLGEKSQAEENLKIADLKNPDGCFPHRLEDIAVLNWAIAKNPENTMVYYYLGNLYYDKKRDKEAVACFEKCCKINSKFPTAYRNLSLAYYNKKNDVSGAVRFMETAFSLDTTDARVLMELDVLYKLSGKTAIERLSFLSKYFDIVEERDDLYTEYIALLNLTGDYEKAYQLLMKRNFHPWEGGEGKVPSQYVFSLISLAKESLDKNNPEKAIEYLEKTFNYPHNFGEGKLYGAQENLQYYLLGCSYMKVNNCQKAIECFEKASEGLSEPASVMYYNDQPPETIFCQGLALKKLNRLDQANKIFLKLVSYADTHLSDEIKIDYFAVSLPDFLVFDADLNLRNKVHCLFMKALGLVGLGDTSTAKEYAKKALEEDCCHVALNEYYDFFIKEEFML